MSDSGDDLVSAYFADAVRAGDTAAVTGVAEVNEETARLLIRVHNALSRKYDDPTEHEYFQRVLSRNSSLEANRAVQDQDVTTMSAIKGVSKRRIDASRYTFDDVVEDLFEPSDPDHMLNLVIYAPPPPRGPTGVGKTDFSYSVIERGERVHDGDLSVASNNVTDPFPDVESWTELEAWLEDTDGTKLFLWDEAAQVLQFDDINAGRALSRLIKLLRKYRCHLVVIGHTGKDIPKDVRRMVMFALKESKKKVTIGSGLEEDSAGWMQIKNEMYHLKDVPPTDVEYESLDDKGTFEFDQDDGDDSEELAPQCRATTNSENQCPNDAKYPADDPIVCVNHRHKADELLDDDESESD